MSDNNSFLKINIHFLTLIREMILGLLKICECPTPRPNVCQKCYFEYFCPKYIKILHIISEIFGGIER